MAQSSPDILSCPADRRAEALSLVLCDLAPSQRAEIAAASCGPDLHRLSASGLLVAQRGERICGATWVQSQPGNSAIFWPPQLLAGEDQQTALELARAAAEVLRREEIGLAQALLTSWDSPQAPLLAAAGFEPLAVLIYLSCETDRVLTPPRFADRLEFAVYDESQRERLVRLIERTYEETLDCAALNGKRHMDDVIEGYRATGVYRAENWRFVRQADQDVGVLLLAEYPAAEYWELVYMGLTPEARGRAWGQQIARHAVSLASRARAKRIVLAVDSANEPALNTYRLVGFQAWDRRLVYVYVRH